MSGNDLHTMTGTIPTAVGSLPADGADEGYGSEPGLDVVDLFRSRAPRSEGRSGPPPRSEGRSGPAPRSEVDSGRLAEVMLALSGHMDVEEPNGPSAAEIDEVRTYATLERLAMLGMPFGI